MLAGIAAFVIALVVAVRNPKAILVGTIEATNPVTSSPSPSSRPAENVRDLSPEDLENLRALQDLAAEDENNFDFAVQTSTDWVGIAAATLPDQTRRIEPKNSNLVTQNQIDRLRDLLTESLLAYKSGNAVKILADRLRAPHTIRPEATRWHLRLTSFSNMKTRFCPRSQRKSCLRSSIDAARRGRIQGSF